METLRCGAVVTYDRTVISDEAYGRTVIESQISGWGESGKQELEGKGE